MDYDYESFTRIKEADREKVVSVYDDPDIEAMSGSDDYTIYWDVSLSDTGEIVVLYRSYTGAQIRYYIDPDSGEAYTTELVPGIIDEEEKTDERLNVNDYLE